MFTLVSFCHLHTVAHLAPQLYLSCLSSPVVSSSRLIISSHVFPDYLFKMLNPFAPVAPMLTPWSTNEVYGDAYVGFIITFFVFLAEWLCILFWLYLGTLYIGLEVHCCHQSCKSATPPPTLCPEWGLSLAELIITCLQFSLLWFLPCPPYPPFLSFTMYLHSESRLQGGRPPNPE